MKAQKEAKSLKENPLPPEEVRIVPVSDRVTGCPAELVLDRIVEIDAELEKIQAAVAPLVIELNKQRDALLQRAVNEKIEKGTNAVLVEKKGKEMRNKITDLEAFQLTFKDEYALIRKRQKEDLENEYNAAKKDLDTSEIGLGIADDVIGKDKVSAFVGFQPVKITYEVRRV